MTPLLDVNVLVALTWPNHVHHGLVRSWFRSIGKRGWATCPLTESGFVRISSNKRVLPEARSPREAIEMLRSLTDLSGHRFWADEISVARSEWVARERLVGHRQVSDAHLLAVAIHHKGCLATLDRGILGLVPGEAGDGVVELLTRERS